MPAPRGPRAIDPRRLAKNQRTVLATILKLQGQHIYAHKLAHQTGMSQTSVRDALARLEQLGWIRKRKPIRLWKSPRPHTPIELVSVEATRKFLHGEGQSHG